MQSAWAGLSQLTGPCGPWASSMPGSFTCLDSGFSNKEVGLLTFKLPSVLLAYHSRSWEITHLHNYLIISVTLQISFLILCPLLENSASSLHFRLALPTFPRLLFQALSPEHFRFPGKLCWRRLFPKQRLFHSVMHVLVTLDSSHPDLLLLISL